MRHHRSISSFQRLLINTRSVHKNNYLPCVLVPVSLIPRAAYSKAHRNLIATHVTLRHNSTTDSRKNSGKYDNNAKNDDASTGSDVVTTFPMVNIPNDTADWDILVQRDHDNDEKQRQTETSVGGDDEEEGTTGTVGFDYTGLYNPLIHLPSSPFGTPSSEIEQQSNERTGATNHWWLGYEPETPLSREVIALIGVTGRPISIAEYMRMALQDPAHGYYTTASKRKRQTKGEELTSVIEDDFFDTTDYDNEVDATNKIQQTASATTPRIGRTGDFITAPEITSMFGECIAVWFHATIIQQHEQLMQQQKQMDEQQQPDQFWYNYQWVELGPGNGSLMVDLLRTSHIIKKQYWKQHQNSKSKGGLAFQCYRVHFIETSPVLRQMQKERLIQEFRTTSSTSSATNSNKEDELVLTFPEDDNTIQSNKNDISSTTNIVVEVYWHHTLIDFRRWSQKQEEKDVQEELRHQGTSENSTNNKKNMKTWFIGQEFLDALPIYAFEKTKHGYWRERMVDVAIRDDIAKSIYEDDDETSMNMKNKEQQPRQQQHDNEENKSTTDSRATTANLPIKKPRLRIVLAPEATPALKLLLRTDDEGYIVREAVVSDSSATNDHHGSVGSSSSVDTAPIGSIIEVCPEAVLTVKEVATILRKEITPNHDPTTSTLGGAALFIDYGSALGSRDTIRAYTNHKQVHFLSQPGLVDITADVDFGSLKYAVNNDNTNYNKNTINLTNSDDISRTVVAHGPTTQGEFLMAMGMKERMIAYVEDENTTDEMAENAFNAMVTLASHEQMGERYKVLGICTTIGITSTTTNELPPPGF